jgi:two-component system, response regulator RegA
MTSPHRPLLIIDDDQSFCDVLARSLGRKGFAPRTAATIQDSLQICREQSPSYILLDLNLAGQSGLGLVQPLLCIVPTARIVILTGYASIPTTVAALKLGAHQYLPKPAHVAEIVSALLDDGIVVPDVASADRMSVQHLEWEYIQRTLDAHDGNISATAQALKMHRRTLQRKLGKKRPTIPVSLGLRPAQAGLSIFLQLQLQLQLQAPGVRQNVTFTSAQQSLDSALQFGPIGPRVGLFNY